jgi:FKBP-type peptidyl-prolyl cis-trans isomerase (trigger factor)
METSGRSESSGDKKFTDIAKLFKLAALPDSEVELAADIPYSAVEPYRAQALAHMAEHMNLPGFRPGKVPADMALKSVGEIAVLEEAVELFMKDFYIELIEEHKVDPVGRPNIAITKLAPGNPVGLTVRVSVYPSVEAPKDWKKLAGQIALEASEPATQEEVEKTIADLQKSRATKGQDGAEVLPEINDEFAKSLGAFDSLIALREQISKGITEEKARQARDKRRGKLIEALLEKSDIEVPSIFVESELQKILAQMREDIGRMGMQMDDYLKRVGKTEDDIKSEFRDQARKRAKLQLLLNRLAEDEKVSADEEAVEAEIKHALEHFPEAKPDLVRVHIETVLRNEKVLKILEGETNPSNEPAAHGHAH